MKPEDRNYFFGGGAMNGYGGMPQYGGGFNQGYAGGQQQKLTYNCFQVFSREEASASRLDPFTLGNIMPDFGHGMIYVKFLNQKTGAAEVIDFAYKPPESVQMPQGRSQSSQGAANVEYVPREDFNGLWNAVRQMQKEIENLKNVKEGVTDDQPAV